MRGASCERMPARAPMRSSVLNRLPTVTIREGHRIKVYLTTDLELPAYIVSGSAPAIPARQLFAGGRP